MKSRFGCDWVNGHKEPTRGQSETLRTGNWGPPQCRTSMVIFVILGKSVIYAFPDWLNNVWQVPQTRSIFISLIFFFLINILFFMSLSSESRLFTESMLSWPLILSHLRIISSLNQMLIVWMLHLYYTWYPWNCVQRPWTLAKTFFNCESCTIFYSYLILRRGSLEFLKIIKIFPF